MTSILNLRHSYKNQFLKTRRATGRQQNANRRITFKHDPNVQQRLAQWPRLSETYARRNESHARRNYEKEWWHFTLTPEPFPDTYFNFPVR